MTTDLLLALDFGGTKLSAAIASRATLETRPAWTALRRVFTPADANAAYEYATMIALGHELLGGRRPLAIGVSFGGPVDFDRGLVRLSHHVSGWEQTPLAALLEGEFGAPTIVDNDANIAALAEHRFGAGRGIDHLMYVTVSTGVGGGWVLGGRPFRGAGGMAGEIGHTVVDPAGPLCLCGKRGCVERLASGPTMAADAEALLSERPGAGMQLRAGWSGEPGTLTGKQVAEAAEAGDTLAREVLVRGARALGAGIGNAANLVNPARFILGGGVTKSGDLWWSAVSETARATALPEVAFDIVPAALGDDAPLWGAVALAALERG
jgi:glucokinase